MDAMRRTGRFAFAIVTALVTGCASQTQATRAPPANVNLSGYPPAFRQGYADGCASVDAARRRDEDRFRTDATYAMGWRDGFDICRRRK